MIDKITYEDWQWSSTERVYLTSFPIATKGNTLAILTSYYINGYPTYFILLMSKNHRYFYEFGNNSRDCRTIWELEVQKSRLINEGFKMNWYNYQLILNMYVQHFKIYSPFIME